MTLSSTGVPKTLFVTYPNLRQEQFINVWWIKNGFEIFVGILDIQLVIHQKYISTINTS